MSTSLQKINIYDFICSTSSYADQLKFGKSGETFIDYHCPITDEQARGGSHKNCLLYIVQGRKGYESLDNYHLSNEHQVLFIRKGGFVLHQQFGKPYHALIFMFDDADIKSIVAEYPGLLSKKIQTEGDFMDQPIVIELLSSPIIRSIFTSSINYLKQPSAESHISLELKFKELLVNLLRVKENNPFYLYLSWLCNDESTSFIKLIRDNSHFNFTTEELARTAAMSVSKFKRVFKNHFGVTPGKWLQEQRIARAIAMLSGENKTISEIAFQLGYSDVASFSKAFKKSTSKNPSDYLKNYRLN
jgi:AraC family transcriptional regulator, exoenzyme S synthesis regulatory protein ExsA